MARLDLPIGVLKHPLEPGACVLCPDGGRGRGTEFCAVLETPVCDECCAKMWAGDAYRLLAATARLGQGRHLGELLRACMHCEKSNAEATADFPRLPN